jgi:hypothetical protein
MGFQMRIKTSYVADDGTEFNTESECRNHEAKISKVIADELATVNRLCKFFNSGGRQISLDYRFNEADVYGVRIKCSADEVDDVMIIFKNHFDDLYYALEYSEFQTNCEVILVYDWINGGEGWYEVDYEKQEWFAFISAVLGQE